MAPMGVGYTCIAKNKEYSTTYYLVYHVISQENVLLTCNIRKPQHEQTNPSGAL